MDEPQITVLHQKHEVQEYMIPSLSHSRKCKASLL